MATLGERIKSLRIRDGITQRELRDIMNYKETRSIQRIEANETLLDNRQLCLLADYFNVTVDYLVGRSDHIWRDILC